MSLKHANSAQIVAWTTGTGIVIGTNVDIAGVYVGSVATTVNIYSGATQQMQSTSSIDFYPPIACANGPITATSSGGSFYVAFVPR